MNMEQEVTKDMPNKFNDTKKEFSINLINNKTE
jgi:hypothetical protein